MEQRRRVDFTYPQFLHGIPFMAKEPGVKLQTERQTSAKWLAALTGLGAMMSSGNNTKADWQSSNKHKPSDWRRSKGPRQFAITG